jgi:DNA-binding response OmpR family regulator
MKSKTSRPIFQLLEPELCLMKLASGFDLDLFSLSLSYGPGRSIKLSHKEFQCLWIFDQLYPEGVRREVFMRAIWPHKSTSMQSGSFDALLFTLRSKLTLLGFEIGWRLGSYRLIHQMAESAAS